MRSVAMLDDLPLDQPLPFRSAGGSESLDLNALLAPNPLSTFYMRVAGHGLRSRGVLDGDLLVIDRAIEPQPGCLVVVAHRGTFLLRPLQRDGEGRWWLEPLRPDERPIPLEIEDVHASPLFGVAVHGVHRLGLEVAP
jgi:DNA polymerase V